MSISQYIGAGGGPGQGAGRAAGGGAGGRAVVHVKGKTRFHVGRDTGFFNRVLLGFYEFLHGTCRSVLPARRSGFPLQQRVEVGMLYKA